MTNEEISLRIFEDLTRERQRQNRLFPNQRHSPLEWLSLLGEEVGEACQAANQAHWGREDWNNYRTEVVQVVSVGIAALICLDLYGPPVQPLVFPEHAALKRVADTAAASLRNPLLSGVLEDALIAAGYTFRDVECR